MRLSLFALLLAFSLPAPAASCPTSLPQDQLNACWVRAYETANERLDQLLGELRRSLGGRNWAHLSESQDHWARSRAIDCKVEASLIEGPAREAVRYGCSEQRTRERLHQLRFYLCPRYNVTGQCEAARRYE